MPSRPLNGSSPGSPRRAARPTRVPVACNQRGFRTHGQSVRGGGVLGPRELLNRSARGITESSCPPPPRLLVNGRVLLAELSRRGDVCRLARYRGHKLTEEWPVGPSLRSSAAPDRPRPGLPTPGRVCHSHNAVGKFACSDEFAVATGSLCRAPPPPGSCHHSGEDSRWCSWSTEQSDFDESLDGSEIPVFDPWAVEFEAVIFLRRPKLIRPGLLPA